jgi:hypothetical protein
MQDYSWAYSTNPTALDSRARRAAKRANLRAVKMRWRAGTIDNYGGYSLVDVNTNTLKYGDRFTLTADDVIRICADEVAC